MEEEPIQEVQKKNETHIHIPIEIVMEILDRLPLKSLARFKCVCILWSSLIEPIIDRRLQEKIDRKVSKLDEARQSIEAVRKEKDERDGVDIGELRAYGVRLKVKVDEVLSIVCAEDDIIQCYGCRERAAVAM